MTDQRVEPAATKKPVDGRAMLAATLVIDLALPLIVFYGLRAAGVAQVWAVLLGVLAPVVHTVYGIVRHRKVSGLAIMVMTLLVASIVVSLITGSSRILLAKDAAVTGIAGLWLLATLLAERPAMFHAGRPFADAKAAEGEDWDTKWRREPAFRYTLRVMTAVWGCALLIDGGVRVLIAYTLPVDLVPLVANVQYGVLTGALWAFTAIYAGRRQRIGRPEPAAAAAPAPTRPSYVEDGS
jgi:hypothetical protein